MSTLKVAAIQGVSASSDAITLANDGTCTANITNNLSNRNLLINGAMQVAQRADLTTAASGYGAVDRWYLYNAGDGRITMTQATDVPSTNEFKYSLKLDVTTADTAGASSRGWIGQWLEARDSGVTLKGTSAAKKVTVQFWVKSPKTGTHIVGLGDSNATTGSANSRFVNVTYTVSSANTWEKKTVTFPADTTGVFNTTTARGLWLGFRLVAGSNSTSGTLATSWQDYATANEGAGQVNVLDNTSNDFYLTGVQAELGDYSSNFDHRSFGDELARCQRYYETHNSLTTAKTTDGSVTSQWSTITSNDSNTLVVSTGIIYKVPKRASPTVTLYNSSDTTTAARVNAQGTERTVTASYGGPNALTRIYVSGASAGNYVTYNWEASAEL